MMARRWGKIICAVAACLVLVDAVMWLLAVDRLRDSWRDVLAQAQARGWMIAAQAPVAEGWPWAARLRVDGLEMSHPQQFVPGGVAFGVEKLLVELPFLAPTQLVVVPQGRMHGRIGRMSDTPLTATSLSLRAGLVDHSMHLAAQALTAQTLPEPLAVARLALDLRQTSDTLALTGVVDGLGLEWLGEQVPLPGPVSHLAFTAILGHEVLTLRDIAVDWGKLGLTGGGTLHADAEGQPEGDGRLAIAGADALLDDLVALGRVTPQNAATAKIVLGFLQRRGADGRMMVELPLRVHQGQVFAGQFPIAVLPPMPPMTGMRP
ncbi:MAG: DUF2125 domain-containing protein [Acetobacteraceae bacterium]|nr:DUF2125 domain-containing protein [Acetobacteraceae bacterium]